ncbi:MAG: glycosyltransferase [Acidobacteriota bacterium]
MGSALPLKILFVVPYAPTRVRTRPFHLIRSLAGAGHRVTLAALWTQQEGIDLMGQLAEHLDGLLTERIAFSRSLWNCARALPTRQPVQACYSWSPAFAAKLTELWKTGGFDVAHVEHLRGARYGLLLKELVKHHPTRPAPVVWDSVDCISGLFRQASKQSQTFRSRFTSRIELPRTERFEGHLATQFGRILVTSQVDRSELLTLAQEWCTSHNVAMQDRLANRIAVVPNGVDLDYFTPNHKPRQAFTLVISGKMSYHANVTAVVRFVKDIMPLVWAQFPQARLWIVGKDPAPEVQRLGTKWVGDQPFDNGRGARETRVQITGTVEDVRPFLQNASLAVAPILYGAGIQNKVLEALACETPVVATPQAVAALQVRSGEQLLVAHDRLQLANAVLQLLRDSALRSRLGRAGRVFVERHHEWYYISQRLVQIYRDAMTISNATKHKSIKLSQVPDPAHRLTLSHLGRV